MGLMKFNLFLFNLEISACLSNPEEEQKNLTFLLSYKQNEHKNNKGATG